MTFTPIFAQGGAFGGDLLSFMPLILIFVIFWFFLIRPQQKKMKEHRDMVAALRRGDQVVTAGGVMGKVTKVLDETTVQVEIAEDVRVRIVKGTISDVLNKTEPAAANTNDDKSEPSGGGEKKSLFSFGGKK
jgi:preprotein translocase subunit YajC